MYRYIICAFSMIFGITLWPLLCCNGLAWSTPATKPHPDGELFYVALQGDGEHRRNWGFFLIRETSKKWTYAINVWKCMEYESHHLPYKWPSFVGKYTIHGAYGMENLKILNDDPNDHKLRNAMENLDLWWFPLMLTMVLNFRNPTIYPINKWPSFVGFYIPAPWWANMGLMLKNWGFSMPSFTCHWHIPVGFQRTRSPTNAPWLTTWNGPGVSKRSGAPACPGAWSDPWTTQTTFGIPLICLND